MATSDSISRNALRNANNPGLVSIEYAREHDVDGGQPGDIEYTQETLFDHEIAPIQRYQEMATLQNPVASLNILKENIRELAQRREYGGTISLHDLTNRTSLEGRGLSRILTHVEPGTVDQILSDDRSDINGGRIDLSDVDKRFASDRGDLVPEGTDITRYEFDVNDPEQLNLLTSMVLATMHGNNVTDPELRSYRRQMDVESSTRSNDHYDFRGQIGEQIEAYKRFLNGTGLYGDPPGLLNKVELPSGALSLRISSNINRDYRWANQQNVVRITNQIDTFVEAFGWKDKASSIDTPMGQLGRSVRTFNDHDFDNHTSSGTSQVYMDGFLDLSRTTEDAVSYFAQKRADAQKLPISQTIPGGYNSYGGMIYPRQNELDRIDRMERQYNQLVEDAQQCLEINRDIVPLGLISNSENRKEIAEFLNGTPLLAHRKVSGDLPLSQSMMSMAALLTLDIGDSRDFADATGNGQFSIWPIQRTLERILSPEDKVSVQRNYRILAVEELKYFINENLVGDGLALSDEIEITGRINNPEFITALHESTKYIRSIIQDEYDLRFEDIDAPLFEPKMGEDGVEFVSPTLELIETLINEGQAPRDGLLAQFRDSVMLVTPDPATARGLIASSDEIMGHSRYISMGTQIVNELGSEYLPNSLEDMEIMMEGAVLNENLRAVLNQSIQAGVIPGTDGEAKANGAALDLENSPLWLADTATANIIHDALQTTRADLTEHAEAIAGAQLNPVLRDIALKQQILGSIEQTAMAIMQHVEDPQNVPPEVMTALQQVEAFGIQTMQSFQSISQQYAPGSQEHYEALLEIARSEDIALPEEILQAVDDTTRLNEMLQNIDTNEELMTTLRSLNIALGLSIETTPGQPGPPRFITKGIDPIVAQRFTAAQDILDIKSLMPESSQLALDAALVAIAAGNPVPDAPAVADIIDGLTQDAARTEEENTTGNTSTNTADGSGNAGSDSATTEQAPPAPPAPLSTLTEAQIRAFHADIVNIQSAVTDTSFLAGLMPDVAMDRLRSIVSEQISDTDQRAALITEMEALPTALDAVFFAINHDDIEITPDQQRELLATNISSMVIDRIKYDVSQGDGLVVDYPALHNLHYALQNQDTLAEHLTVPEYISEPIWSQTEDFLGEDFVAVISGYNEQYAQLSDPANTVTGTPIEPLSDALAQHLGNPTDTQELQNLNTSVATLQASMVAFSQNMHSWGVYQDSLNLRFIDDLVALEGNADKRAEIEAAFAEDGQTYFDHLETARTYGMDDAQIAVQQQRYSTLLNMRSLEINGQLNEQTLQSLEVIQFLAADTDIFTRYELDPLDAQAGITAEDRLGNSPILLQQIADSANTVDRLSDDQKTAVSTALESTNYAADPANPVLALQISIIDHYNNLLHAHPDLSGIEDQIRSQIYLIEDPAQRDAAIAKFEDAAYLSQKIDLAEELADSGQITQQDWGKLRTDLNYMDAISAIAPTGVLDEATMEALRTIQSSIPDPAATFNGFTGTDPDAQGATREEILADAAALNTALNSFYEKRDALTPEQQERLEIIISALNEGRSIDDVATTMSTEVPVTIGPDGEPVVETFTPGSDGSGDRPVRSSTQAQDQAYSQRLRELQAAMGHDTVDGTLNEQTQIDLKGQIANALHTYLRGQESRTIVKDGQEYRIDRSGDVFLQNADGTEQQQGNVLTIDRENTEAVAHPLLWHVLNDVETSLKDDYKAEKLLEIERQQNDILARFVDDPSQRAEIISQLHQAKNERQAREIIRPHFTDAAGDDLNSIVANLWALEESHKLWTTSPDFSGIADDLTNPQYQAFHALAATHDIIGYFVTGNMESRLDYLRSTAHNQPEGIPIGYDDRFFVSDVYYQIYEDGEVDGSLIGSEYRGKKLDRAELALIALDRFVEAAGDAGIATGDITRAMMEGDFNPYWEDVKLAREGLVPDGSLDIMPGLRQEMEHINRLQGSAYDEALEDLSTRVRGGAYASEGTQYLDSHLVVWYKQNGITPRNDILPNTIYLQQDYAVQRDNAWNAQFGKMSDLNNVTTMVTHTDGSVEVKENLSQQDLGVRLLQRTNGPHFEQAYGIRRNSEMDYEGAVSAIREAHGANANRVIAALNNEIRNVMEANSVYTYFDQGTDRPTNFNLQGDYQAMRREEYLPSLQDDLRPVAQTVDNRAALRDNTTEVTGTDPASPTADTEAPTPTPDATPAPDPTTQPGQ